MSKQKTTTLLTRVMFCQTCFDNKFPQKGQLFLTIGRGRQKYEVRPVTNNGRFGFTPHIIEKTHAANGEVTFAASCCMNGCESIIELNEDSGRYDIAVTTATVHKIPIRDWNALVLYTRDNDYWLG